MDRRVCESSYLGYAASALWTEFFHWKNRSSFPCCCPGATRLVSAVLQRRIRPLRQVHSALKYRQLALAQRKLARCKHGSHRRERARKAVARAHRKIGNQRRDFLHKAARSLVNRDGVIVMEDLKITNLLAGKQTALRITNLLAGKQTALRGRRSPALYQGRARKPLLKSLSFTHILQTEVSSQMNTLQHDLHMQPALPERFPAWRPIPPSPQMPSQPRDFLPEPRNRHLLRGQREGSSNACHSSRFYLLDGWRLWRLTRQIAQWQQTHGDGREQPQQADQPLDSAQGTLLQTAAGFEALMILFHDPATAIPVHALPGVLTCRRFQRRQQNPFKRFF